MPTQIGGGSIAQSLRYVDPAAPERSASAGSDLLKESGLIARPAIGGGTRKSRKGGFYPSVMTGVVNAGIVLAPLTALAARKLFSRKTRKGGGRKGERFLADKEEAKRQLENIGKPSAANVLAFVAAKRRGSAEADIYINGFRKKKQNKEEANQAKRRAKEEKKAAKAAERAAKKATRKAKKAANVVKPASNVSSASTVSNNNNTNNNSYRAPTNTKAQLMREAEENAARAKAEMNAARVKKPLKNSQVAWLSLIANAQQKLKANGVPTRKNAMRYASLLKQGKAEAASEFLENFRGRSRKVNAKAKAATPKAATPPAAEAPKKATATNGSIKKRKSPSPAQKAYFEALSTAKTVLGTLGKPKASNRAKWASLKVSKKNNAAESLAKFEQDFATRMSMEPAKVNKPVKKEMKPLTAVNENNMQGYSENFESESST
jgi:hypothetical protein